MNKSYSRVVVPKDLDTGTSTETSTWKDVQLKDINTQTSFKISDFNKPILLESFAVWCPKCTSQQEKIKELHEEVGDSVISISLNTCVVC